MPTQDVESVAPRGPAAIHIIVVVYGEVFTTLFADVTLYNLAAMVREIPPRLRARSRLRIFTTAEDGATIEGAAALKLLRGQLSVDIVARARVEGFDRHGDYGPLVLTQQLAVMDAAKEDAVIFFVGPDQIYSRGAFRFFIDRLQAGYRMVVGPGLRIDREAVRPVLNELIKDSPDGSFAPTPEQQADLLFDYYHPINDKYVLGCEHEIYWKAFLYHRPRPDLLMIRFLQGPTLAAWPRKVTIEPDRYIDHSPDWFCHSWRDVYVVSDKSECLALDMMDSERTDTMTLATFSRAELQGQLFDKKYMHPFQLHYARKTCRIYRGEHPGSKLRSWERQLSSAVDQHLLLALAERKVRANFGPSRSAVMRLTILANVHSLGWFLRPVRNLLWR
jgi:hypothetical protein